MYDYRDGVLAYRDEQPDFPNPYEEDDVSIGVCDKCKGHIYEGERTMQVYGDIVCAECCNDLPKEWCEYLDFLVVEA